MAREKMKLEWVTAQRTQILITANMIHIKIQAEGKLGFIGSSCRQAKEEGQLYL